MEEYSDTEMCKENWSLETGKWLRVSLTPQIPQV